MGLIFAGMHLALRHSMAISTTLQSCCLGLYRVSKGSGLLSTGWGSSLFEWAYHAYKRYLEARETRVLGGFVEPGSVVIDVGANIGFFTRFFAERVSEGGKVIAIEPEESNYQRLNQ